MNRNSIDFFFIVLSPPISDGLWKNGQQYSSGVSSDRGIDRIEYSPWQFFGIIPAGGLPAEVGLINLASSLSIFGGAPPWTVCL